MPQSISDLGTERLRRATKTNPLYAKVFFGARRRFALSVTEAVLCDVVFILGRKTGWCFASRAYLARLLGVSDRSVRRMIARLIDLKLLERHPDDERQLRATLLWITENQADDLAGA